MPTMPMTTLSPHEIDFLAAPLDAALVPFMRRFPGDAGDRQPVHTVYGGAHLFKSDTARKLGEKAVQVLEQHGVDPFVFARAIGIEDSQAEKVWQRVVEKLHREPVEDFRIDFEDGYGNRPDEEEDRHAEQVARELVTGMREGTLPPFIGIRIKPFTQELARRGLRTMDLVLSTVLGETGGKLPANFVVTLPKIQLPEQVTLLVDVFDAMETRLELPQGTLRLEFMIETTQSILNERGESNLPRFLDAARGRAVAAHFGTYDYTASCNITAAEQRMDHPACDFARNMMQIAYAGTGLWLSDGATNVLPIGDRETIHRAWRLHVDHVRHSLVNAYYQGWDLHPAQLPTRYAAVYSFFLAGLGAATERLRNFMEKAGQATLVGDVFDDAATGQGLLNYFLRGMNSGALTEEEALATGLTLAELRSRSFVKILQNRRVKSL
jgi:citrate lyase beta subunit